MRSSGALTGSNNVWKDGELVASMNWLDFGPIVPRYRKITSQIPRYNPIASQPKIPLLERSHRTLALFQDIGHLSRSSEVFVRSEVSGSPGGLYSTYQNTSSSPALGHISPRTTSSIIFARQKSISTGSIISDNEATEPLPGFPGTAEQFGKIRNSIANGFILRDPDEEQEIWMLNAMQEMRTEAEEVAIHQGDVSEYFSIVEPGCLDLHTRSECSASWSSPQPSPTSLPSEVEIDPQLLRGVSLEFNPPQISIAKTTLKGGVPNVISLPTGRFVPFHIQAPGWRHFLKMMAQLSGTRVEAFIEAPADSEQELKLRTVVQFVRVNTISQDCRTVLYLTIDNPPPSNTPTSSRTVMLAHCRSVIPPHPYPPRWSGWTNVENTTRSWATPNTPYPTLPVSFRTWLCTLLPPPRILDGWPKTTGAV